MFACLKSVFKVLIVLFMRYICNAHNLCLCVYVCVFVACVYICVSSILCIWFRISQRSIIACVWECVCVLSTRLRFLVLLGGLWVVCVSVIQKKVFNVCDYGDFTTIYINVCFFV